jgi:hypothetical protein
MSDLNESQLPEDWLSSLTVNLSLLTPEQLEQKAAYHEKEALRRERQASELEDQLIHLKTEEQLLLAAQDEIIWTNKLCALFGETIGSKLANHQIEPGMTREHLLYTYGVPKLEDITVEGNRQFWLYGSETTGARFELVDNVVVRAGIITPPPYPAHAFD